MKKCQTILRNQNLIRYRDLKIEEEVEQEVYIEDNSDDDEEISISDIITFDWYYFFLKAHYSLIDKLFLI